MVGQRGQLTQCSVADISRPGDAAAVDFFVLCSPGSVLDKDEDGPEAPQVQKHQRPSAYRDLHSLRSIEEEEKKL